MFDFCLFFSFEFVCFLGGIDELVEACLTLNLFLQLPVDFSKYTADLWTSYLPVIGLQFHDHLMEHVVLEAELVLLVATGGNDKTPS